MSILRHIPAGADPIEELLHAANTTAAGAKPLRRLVVADDIWRALETQATKPVTDNINGLPFAGVELMTPAGSVKVVRDGFMPAGVYFEDRGQFEPRRPSGLVQARCTEDVLLDVADRLFTFAPPKPLPYFCSPFEFDFLTALAAGNTPYLARLLALIAKKPRPSGGGLMQEIAP